MCRALKAISSTPPGLSLQALRGNFASCPPLSISRPSNSSRCRSCPRFTATPSGSAAIMRTQKTSFRKPSPSPFAPSTPFSPAPTSRPGSFASFESPSSHRAPESRPHAQFSSKTVPICPGPQAKIRPRKITSSVSTIRPHFTAPSIFFTPHLREVLLLCDVEELKYKDIAMVLDLPIGTVMSRLSRARSALHQQLKLELGESL